MLKQALILAGGLGTRLGELTQTCPKPLVKVGEKPFLEYIFWNLKRYGITNIVLSVGYMAESICGFVGDGSKYGLKVDYAVEESPAGTGGALKIAENYLHDSFLLINGDTIFDINYLDLELVRLKSGCVLAMALRWVEDASRYGIVEIYGEKVISFREKNRINRGYINGGVYAVDRKILDYINSIPCSLENDVLPRIVSRGMIAGKAYEGFFIDIGVIEDYEAAQKLVPQWKQKPAVFFDRDGVINVDKGYVNKPEDFNWMPGAIESVKLANDNGYLVIVITNQAGIARGYYSEQHFLDFTEWINEQLKNNGAHIDATYYCPHHPTEGLLEYRLLCNCRKPEPGLILKAIEDWEIDVSKSVLFGDKESDIKAASRAGITGIIVGSGELLDKVNTWINNNGFRW